MLSGKVALIAQMVPEPPILQLPSDPVAARNLMRVKNFTHIVTEDNRLVNHLTYLSETTQERGANPYSVWKMYLCAGLLLSSHLKRNGYEVELFNYIDSENEVAEFQRLKNFNPDVVILSTTFILSHADLKAVGIRLRSAVPDTFIVAGGHHIFTSLLYMDEAKRCEYLRTSVFDAFVNDTQGEASLLSLLRNYPDKLDEVPNLLWRKKWSRTVEIVTDTVVENARIPEENDINDTLIDLDLVPVPQGSVIHIRTARSCAFKCAFCSYPTIAGKLALMELDNVIATLRQCRDKGVKSVIFTDDTFNVPRDRFELLIDRMIAENVTIPWYSFLRCQFIDEQLIVKMKKSGCVGVFLGVESGSNSILRNMNKGAKASVYFDAIKILENNGIFTVGSFVIGFPGENADTVYETQEFIERSGLRYYYIQPFYYIHHTPIHKRAADYDLKGTGLFWSHKTMNSGEAIAHSNRLFKEITNSIWVCPDGTLWDIAYLQSLGFNLDQIDQHRKSINALTLAQMDRYQI